MKKYFILGIALITILIASLLGYGVYLNERGENQKDVVILGVGAPGSVDSVDEAGIIAFLDENEFTYPVVMDPDGGLFYAYNATALPTTWLIRKDGQIMGYIPGAMDKETMLDVIQQTLDAI